MAKQTIRTFTTAQKITTLKRELSIRRNVYARDVRANRMTQKTMDWEIEVMEAILMDYEQKQEE